MATTLPPRPPDDAVGDAAAVGDAGAAALRAPASVWGGHSDYMENKNRKLAEQAVALAAVERRQAGGGAGDAAPPPFFSGVYAHANGATSPPASELTRLLQLHGGFCDVALSPRVTHIICSEHVSDSTLRRLRHRRAGAPPVVVAGWVTACVAVGRSLPVARFLHPAVYAPEPGVAPAPPGGLWAAAGARARGGGEAGAVRENPPPLPSPPPPPPPPPQPPPPPPHSESPARLAVAARAACPLLHSGPLSNSRTNPRHLEEYQKASRLHHIGAWRDPAAAALAALPPGPRPSPHSPRTERTIFHVDMDAFFVSGARGPRPLTHPCFFAFFCSAFFFSHFNRIRPQSRCSSARSCAASPWSSPTAILAATQKSLAPPTRRARPACVPPCSSEQRRSSARRCWCCRTTSTL